MIKKLLLTILMTILTISVQAEEKTYTMVFVPASEKGDESDYKNLISITEKLTGLKIETIKVTDYNAAVESMRAGRAHLAWFGGKTYVKAAEIANAEAFAAGVRPGEKDAGYYTYFVVRNDSRLKKFNDVILQCRKLIKKNPNNFRKRFKVMGKYYRKKFDMKLIATEFYETIKNK